MTNDAHKIPKSAFPLHPGIAAIDKVALSLSIATYRMIIKRNDRIRAAALKEMG